MTFGHKEIIDSKIASKNISDLTDFIFLNSHNQGKSRIKTNRIRLIQLYLTSVFVTFVSCSRRRGIGKINY